MPFIYIRSFFLILQHRLKQQRHHNWTLRLIITISKTSIPTPSTLLDVSAIKFSEFSHDFKIKLVHENVTLSGLFFLKLWIFISWVCCEQHKSFSVETWFKNCTLNRICCSRRLKNTLWTQVYDGTISHYACLLHTLNKHYLNCEGISGEFFTPRLSLANAAEHIIFRTYSILTLIWVF